MSTYRPFLSHAWSHPTTGVEPRDAVPKTTRGLRCGTRCTTALTAAEIWGDVDVPSWSERDCLGLDFDLTVLAFDLRFAKQSYVDRVVPGVGELLAQARLGEITAEAARQWLEDLTYDGEAAPGPGEETMGNL